MEETKSNTTRKLAMSSFPTYPTGLSLISSSRSTLVLTTRTFPLAILLTTSFLYIAAYTAALSQAGGENLLVFGLTGPAIGTFFDFMIDVWIPDLEVEVLIHSCNYGSASLTKSQSPTRNMHRLCLRFWRKRSSSFQVVMIYRSLTPGPTAQAPLNLAGSTCRSQ